MDSVLPEICSNFLILLTAQASGVWRTELTLVLGEPDLIHLLASPVFSKCVTAALLF
jgi:hypothetical protein